MYEQFIYHDIRTINRGVRCFSGRCNPRPLFICVWLGHWSDVSRYLTLLPSPSSNQFLTIDQLPCRNSLVGDRYISFHFPFSSYGLSPALWRRISRRCLCRDL